MREMRTTMEFATLKTPALAHSMYAEYAMGQGRFTNVLAKTLSPVRVTAMAMYPMRLAYATENAMKMPIKMAFAMTLKTACAVRFCLEPILGLCVGVSGDCPTDLDNNGSTGSQTF